MVKCCRNVNFEEMDAECSTGINTPFAESLDTTLVVMRKVSTS